MQLTADPRGTDFLNKAQGKKKILWGGTRYAKHINVNFSETRSPCALYVSQDIYYSGCDWVLSPCQTNAFMRCLKFKWRGTNFICHQGLTDVPPERKVKAIAFKMTQKSWETGDLGRNQNLNNALVVLSLLFVVSWGSKCIFFLTTSHNVVLSSQSACAYWILCSLHLCKNKTSSVVVSCVCLWALKKFRL